MAAVTERAEVSTPGRVSLVNVTGTVRRALSGAGIERGIAVVSVSHTTCGVCINEDEAGLKEDLARMAAELLDPLERQRPFRHDRVDDNARAHLTAILLGQSVAVPVAGRKLVLGTWQSVFLVELDGPRKRQLDMAFVGD